MGKKLSLSSYLKDSRIRAGLSQKDVSDALGYGSAQFVSNWERGVSSPPGNTLRKLAKLYKITLADLYEVLLEETLARAEKDLKKRFFG